MKRPDQAAVKLRIQLDRLLVGLRTQQLARTGPGKHMPAIIRRQMRAIMETAQQIVDEMTLASADDERAD